MLSNEYFLAKFRFDTAENEPAKNQLILLRHDSVQPAAEARLVGVVAVAGIVPWHGLGSPAVVRHRLSLG